MRHHLFWPTMLPLCLSATTLVAQQGPTSSAADAPTTTLSVQARLVVVPAVVFEKKGLATQLTRDSFSLTVDGKPQTIRYFGHDRDLPLTVGLLVDVSGSVADDLPEEQKASEAFLQSMLAPAQGSRPADQAFILQFGRTAELLQDVTASRPLLEAGLKEVGTSAPGDSNEDATDTAANNSQNGQNGSQNGGQNGSNPTGGTGSNGYPGYGRGPYGRNGGNGQNGSALPARRRGTVLYDAVYLASNDVLAKQPGRRALILLTDGEDRHSKESLTEAIEAAQRADVVVFAIYYKGQPPMGGFPGERRGGFGYPGGYGGYPGAGPGSPGSGGRPGSDGTYANPDGRKILERLCGETGGQVFEAKGKGSLEKIYAEIGDQLRSQYRLGFTPTGEAAAAGYHHLQLSLTDPADKNDEIQTREGYYSGPAPTR